MCDANGNSPLKYPVPTTEAEALAESAAVQSEVTKSAEELGNYQNWCTENIHVYEVCEDVWIAAASPESAVMYCLDQQFGEEETLDEFGPPVELSREAMATKRFVDPENPEIKTFLDAFNDMLFAGSDFPVIFATEL